MHSPDFIAWFRRLRILGNLAALGVVILLLAAVIGTDGAFGMLCLIVGLALSLPAFLYLYCLTILHWKHRYNGRHSTLWGVLLLVETSGWFKIVYFFRHILPDMNNRGRYTNPPNQPLQTTPTAVTPAANAPVAPSAGVPEL